MQTRRNAASISCLYALMIAGQLLECHHSYAQLLTTAETGPVLWQYTFTKPGVDWVRSNFDHSAWKEGPAGFGRLNPGAVQPEVRIRTPWTTPAIWLRREFTLTPNELRRIKGLRVFYDNDARIWLNGILASDHKGFNMKYEEFEIAIEARRGLKPGKNLIAVHCIETGGDQYIDVGFSTQTDPDAPRWVEELEDAVAQAASESKNLLLFFDSDETKAADGVEQYLGSAQVSTILREKFVLHKINMEKKQELARKMDVFRAGTINLYDSQGRNPDQITKPESAGQLAEKLRQYAARSSAPAP